MNKKKHPQKKKKEEREERSDVKGVAVGISVGGPFRRQNRGASNRSNVTISLDARDRERGSDPVRPLTITALPRLSRRADPAGSVCDADANGRDTACAIKKKAKYITIY